MIKNTNGILRRDMSRKTDITNHTQKRSLKTSGVALDVKIQRL